MNRLRQGPIFEPVPVWGDHTDGRTDRIRCDERSSDFFSERGMVAVVYPLRDA
jgi:hypothetical protein